MRRKWLVPLLLLALLTLCFLWGVTGYPHRPSPVRGLPGGPPPPPTGSAPTTWGWTSTPDLRRLLPQPGHRPGRRRLHLCGGGRPGDTGGLCGGWADALISFLIQVLLAIPQLPVMIVIGAFLGQSTWNLVWIIAAFSWAPVARQMRAKTISIRRRDYVQMARLYGGGTWYLIRTHIGHELWPLLTINALAVVGRAILQESSLAFLGLSDPLARSWGMMIARAVDFPGLYRTDFWTWWLLPAGGGAGAVHAAAAPAGGRAGGTTEEGQAVLLEVNNLSVSYPEFHPPPGELCSGRRGNAHHRGGVGQRQDHPGPRHRLPVRAGGPGQRAGVPQRPGAAGHGRAGAQTPAYEGVRPLLPELGRVAQPLPHPGGAPAEVLCRAYRGAAMAARMEELMALVGLETADLGAIPGSCPAAWCRSSCWPTPWPSIPPWCCWTSPPAPWTSPPAGGSRR